MTLSIFPRVLICAFLKGILSRRRKEGQVLLEEGFDTDGGNPGPRAG